MDHIHTYTVELKTISGNFFPAQKIKIHVSETVVSVSCRRNTPIHIRVDTLKMDSNKKKISMKQHKILLSKVKIILVFFIFMFLFDYFLLNKTLFFMLSNHYQHYSVSDTVFIFPSVFFFFWFFVLIFFLGCVFHFRLPKHFNSFLAYKANRLLFNVYTNFVVSNSKYTKYGLSAREKFICISKIDVVMPKIKAMSSTKNCTSKNNRGLHDSFKVDFFDYRTMPYHLVHTLLVHL